MTLFFIQEILRKRANAEIVSLAKNSRDNPRAIINKVLNQESEEVNEQMVSDASLRRK